MRMLQPTLVVALLITFFSTSVADEPKKAQKPLLDDMQRTSAIEDLRKLFGNPPLERPEALAKLARRMYDEALATKDDPIGQYLCLEQARDYAGLAGDVELARLATKAIIDRYDVSRFDSEFSLIRALSKSAPRSAGCEAAKRMIFPLASDLMQDSKFDEASQALALMRHAMRPTPPVVPVYEWALEVVGNLIRKGEFAQSSKVMKVAKSTSVDMTTLPLANQMVLIWAINRVSELERIDDFATARQVLLIANDGFSDSRIEPTRKALESMSKAIEANERQFKAAMADIEKLKTQFDGDTSLRAGTYLCFLRNRWNEGLPLLAKGSDPSLSKLAKRDLEQPKDDADRLRIADDWYNLAQTQEKPQQLNISLRALLWYESVDGKTSGLTKLRTEKRLVELVKYRTETSQLKQLTGVDCFEAFKGRFEPIRSSLVKREGAENSEKVVRLGIEWLVRMQEQDGRWKLFPDKGPSNDAAATAFGLLPLLGSGKTHRANSEFNTEITRGIDYLASIQDRRSGAFSKDSYSHALCTLAMCEAYGMTKDARLKAPAQAAINFIVAAQHTAGGWRYSPGQAGDTSVSSWQIMALKSGSMAGLNVPPATFRKAQNYLDNVLHARTEGYGYTDGDNPTKTMTAAALLSRQNLQGWGPQNLRMIKAVENYIKPNYPRSDVKDVYYYYYATQVMHRFGGDEWKSWNTKNCELLVKSQNDDHTKPEVWGSWSPAGDNWGPAGGRLMVTSLNLLILEEYYRYQTEAVGPKEK